MKDAKGHGSNTHGGSAVVARTGSSARGVMPSRPYRQGQPPVTSNAEAAQALMSGLKSTQAPVHDSMAGQPIGSLARGQNSTTPASRGPAPWYDTPINEPFARR